MRLVVSNQTGANLHFRNVSDDAQRQGWTCLPAFSSNNTDLRKNPRLQISQFPIEVSYDEKAVAKAVTVRLPQTSRAIWELLPGFETSPWIVYFTRPNCSFAHLVAMTRRDPSRFLKSIPDSVPLSSLMLPGTHDTMAFYGWPITQCQSPTNALDIQLNSGIRVLDIRLAIIESRLISYHGVVSQRTSFADILRQLHAFLTAPSTCSETVVVSIKQEDQDPPLFSRLVREEIMTSPGGIDMWYLENRIPNLGEVRGKAVMFSRFGGNGYGWKDCAIGIHPPLWPDSPRLCFSWDCGNTLVQTQDWYAIPSFLWIPEKAAISTEILIPLGDCPDPVLSITFLSASSVPLALPPVIAQGFGWPKCMVGFEGVNSRVGRWLLERLIGPSQEERKGDVGPRIRGWALMDFFEVPEGLVPLFIECNFRGRRVGEEGWF